MPDAPVQSNRDKVADKAGAAARQPTSPIHELLDTVVYVAVLVIILKTFVAEAYDIPTGSMATSLLGLHREVTCEKCGYGILVNYRESEEWRGTSGRLAVCPNCRHTQPVPPRVYGGDKVLVAKTHYALTEPARMDVIVFMFPQEPTDPDYRPKNYIKRLWGLPGEKLSIWYGDLYLRTGGGGGDERREIIRKPAAKMLEMRRIVYDDDYRPRDLADVPRWLDEGPGQGWQPSPDGKGYQVRANEQPRWLRYRHLLRVPTGTLREQLESLEQLLRADRFAAAHQRQETEEQARHVRELLLEAERIARQPQLVTDFLDYNAGDGEQGFVNWVSDLMVECEVEVSRLDGEFYLELVSGADRHQVRFDLRTGRCRVQSWRHNHVLTQSPEAATGISSIGRHRVRFANFDARLTVWVDRRLPFGDGWDYAPPSEQDRGPCVADLRPVAIGARNTEVTVRHVQVWRDIYYTRTPYPPEMFDGRTPPVDLARLLSLSEEELRALKNDPLAKPEKWERCRGLQPMDYEVGPDQYFALGDNSPLSRDSRDWGLVPRHLLLGKAAVVYWPLDRWKRIR
ncbi:MAG: hypothetical protein C4297_02920 [Gemmataceae bacterium]